MVKLLVYGYCLGVRSSRKAQRLVEDVPFRVLAAATSPTSARFPTSVRST